MAKIKEIREIILKELPSILEHDKEVQEFILRLSKDYFADRGKTEDRFDKILNELTQDREAQEKKWQENQKVLQDMLESIKALSRKHDNTIG